MILNFEEPRVSLLLIYVFLTPPFLLFYFARSHLQPSVPSLYRDLTPCFRHEDRAGQPLTVLFFGATKLFIGSSPMPCCVRPARTHVRSRRALRGFSRLSPTPLQHFLRHRNRFPSRPDSPWILCSASSFSFFRDTRSSGSPRARGNGICVLQQGFFLLFLFFFYACLAAPHC